MREYQHKYIIRTLLYSPITIIALFLVIVLMVRSIVELNDKRLMVTAQKEEAKAKQADMERKLAKAEEKSTEIMTERGLEAYMRTTYPVVKEGEGVIVVYDSAGSVVTPVRENLTVWERLTIWWRQTFGRQVVAAGLCTKCEVQVSYAIGFPQPTSILVDSFGTGKIPDEKIAERVKSVFNFSPGAIEKLLKLRDKGRTYLDTAAYGHFGRDGETFTWEKTDKADSRNSNQCILKTR